MFQGEKMEIKEKDYLMSTIEEYFAILDEENQMRSKMVAKSLAKYLKKNQTTTKFDKLVNIQGQSLLREIIYQGQVGRKFIGEKLIVNKVPKLSEPLRCQII